MKVSFKVYIIVDSALYVSYEIRSHQNGDYLETICTVSM